MKKQHSIPIVYQIFLKKLEVNVSRETLTYDFDLFIIKKYFPGNIFLMFHVKHVYYYDKNVIMNLGCFYEISKLI